MLVIPRKINDQIVIGDVTVTVVAIDERAGKVRLAVGSAHDATAPVPSVRRCPPEPCDALESAKVGDWQEGMKAEDRKE